MNSFTTERFRACLGRLPEPIQKRALRSYRVFQKDPNHPSLHFKQVHGTRPVYSARVGLGYRALGVREGDAIVWFWIGTHAEYDQLVSSL